MQKRAARFTRVHSGQLGQWVKRARHWCTEINARHLKSLKLQKFIVSTLHDVTSIIIDQWWKEKLNKAYATIATRTKSTLAVQSFMKVKAVYNLSSGP